MNIYDIVILLILAVCIILALCFILKNKKNGKCCCGNCSDCGACCYKNINRNKR